jgi:hypothetical protein
MDMDNQLLTGTKIDQIARNQTGPLGSGGMSVRNILLSPSSFLFAPFPLLHELAQGTTHVCTRSSYSICSTGSSSVHRIPHANLRLRLADEYVEPNCSLPCAYNKNDPDLYEVLTRIGVICLYHSFSCPPVSSIEPCIPYGYDLQLFQYSVHHQSLNSKPAHVVTDALWKTMTCGPETGGY